MKKKVIRWGILIFIVALIIGGGYAYYLWNMPQRDVQSADIDIEITSSQLVQEYLTDVKAANSKYLQEEGDSKILAVEGSVSSINTDMNNQKVIILKEENDKAGVSCTFTTLTNANANKLAVGDRVKIKGVFRSGAGYDEDLELYEDVIMEKCDVVTK